jgi:hypothetical protein
MRNFVAKMVIGAVVTAVGMFAADSSQGTWKFNAAKSKSTSANPVKSQTDVREATPDGGTKLTRTSQLADGTAINYTVSLKYDGKEYRATGAPYDLVSIKRVNANTTGFDTRKAGGKYHMAGQNVVSKDGKTLTQTATGIDAQGKPVAATSVFDKQ